MVYGSFLESESELDDDELLDAENEGGEIESDEEVTDDELEQSEKQELD